MNIEDIEENNRCKFTRLCKCGNKIVVYTILEKNPKCNKNIYVLCNCGHYCEFNLLFDNVKNYSVKNWMRKLFK